jgi:hypothetical protein
MGEVMGWGDSQNVGLDLAIAYPKPFILEVGFFDRKPKRLVRDCNNETLANSIK